MKFTDQLCTAFAAVAVLTSSAACATTLQARDINSDGVIDAYYDSSSNLTWLADANLIKTSGYLDPRSAPQPDANGNVYWDVAKYWADHLNMYGVTGWRLPTLLSSTSCVPMGFHSVCSQTVTAGTSELENLFKNTLGNPTGSTANFGPFLNVQTGSYWTGAQVPSVPGSAPYWIYGVSTGTHAWGNQFGSYYSAWAVHSGDIPGAVPEASTLALAFAGLGSLLTSRKLFRR